MLQYRFVVLLLLVGLISCRVDRTKVDDTIHIRLKKDPERINPLIFPNPLSREVYQYLHLPLADYNPESLELEPILIKMLPTAMDIDTGKYTGGVRFQMEILDEAKWDDGSPVTGWDYLFTIKAIKHPLTNAARYRDNIRFISDVIVNADNPKKLEVIFSKKYLLALETAVTVELYPEYFYDPSGSLKNLSLSSLADSEEKAAKISGDSSLVSFANVFNGTEFSRSEFSGIGPYRFVSWDTDQFVVLEKKEDYWAKDRNEAWFSNGPDKIVFHIIADELTAVTQLKEGLIDVMNELSGDAFEDLRNDVANKEKFSFFTPALMKYYMINLNNLDIRLEDKRVRRALAHLLDMDKIIANIENGLGVRTVGPIYPSKKTYNSDLKPIPFDINQAKSLLSESGWTDSNKDGIVDKVVNGKRVEMQLDIYISGQELGKRIAIMLQESGLQAGIKFNIIEKDFKLIRAENLKKRNYHLVPTVISMDINTWDDLSGRWHGQSDTPEGANDVSYHNSQCDLLLDKLEESTSDVERLKLYREIQKLIYDDQPAIFLYAPFEKIVVSSKWQASATVKRPGYMANTFRLLVNGVPVEN
ncbi:MAG: hypothetical protein IPM42_06885 [Saprospiraceae bacterium]|nr:hypothetical protein [Saprospiraceae bacterium]